MGLKNVQKENMYMVRHAWLSCGEKRLFVTMVACPPLVFNLQLDTCTLLTKNIDHKTTDGNY